MIVYLDIILLLNIVFNAMILMLTRYFVRSNRSKKRIIYGSIVASLLVVIEMYLPLSSMFNFVSKIMYSIIIVIITLGWNGIMSLCKHIGVFYFTSFSIGGGMFGFHYLLKDMFTYHAESPFLTVRNIYGEDIQLMFVVVSFPLIWFFTKRRMDEHVQVKIKYDQFYKVRLTLNGQSYETTGYIDSGNHLIDPITRRPVVLCDEGFLKHFFNEEDWQVLVNCVQNTNDTDLPASIEHKVFIVPFQGVGGETNFLYTIKPDEIIVFYEGKQLTSSQVLVGIQLQPLTEDRQYQCLLHPQLIHFSTEKSA